MSILRRRRPCSPSASSPLDVDDLLSEILLRLPPHPSSLPRASAVCKRWRLLVSDPRFVRRFQVHHRRNPPLLGCFVAKHSGLSLLPTMEAPDRVSLEIARGDYIKPLGCRHGLALIRDQRRQKFLVCDPITGDRHQVANPPGFDLKTSREINAAVLRVGAGDVHFRLVFVATGCDGTHTILRALAHVYSSETGLWGDLISTPIPLAPGTDAGYYGILFYLHSSVSTAPSVLVGDCLYWKLIGRPFSILEFDFEKQSLAVMQVPMYEFVNEDSLTVIRADGGGLGFLFVSNFTAKLWERNTDCDGVASWVLGRTIELDKLLSLDSEVVGSNTMMLGLAEENNTLILRTAIGVFAVQLPSLQFKKLTEFNVTTPCYPFESVYTAGIGGEHDARELLHNA